MTVCACASFIGYAMAKANPLVGIIADRVMAEVDADGDRQVTQDEFAHAREVRFHTADRNGDNYISRGEFTQELVSVAGELGLVWSDQFFATLDRDGDNLLARDEIDTLAEHAFAKADRNGDGFVTPTEVHPSLAMAD